MPVTIDLKIIKCTACQMFYQYTAHSGSRMKYNLLIEQKVILNAIKHVLNFNKEASSCRYEISGVSFLTSAKNLF